MPFMSGCQLKKLERPEPFVHSTRATGADRNRPLMQTAPPSRIMLGGAVLNPDSAIPRQLSVCGGYNKVQRAEATEAALPVDLSELLLLSATCSSPRHIRACRAGR